jgi:hypothetical protein
MEILLVVLSIFDRQALNCQDYVKFCRKWPQLALFGFELRGVAPDVIEKIMNVGDLARAATPRGVVVLASFRTWTSIIPGLLSNKDTSKVAASINAILAKQGLSCR